MFTTHHRPEGLDDILMFVYPGGWYGWKPNQPHIYENIVVYPTVNEVAVTNVLPSKEELDTFLVNSQVEWDANSYKAARNRAYPSIADQLDMQYHDGVNGTTTWADAIAAVKTKYAKP